LQENPSSFPSHKIFLPVTLASYILGLIIAKQDFFLLPPFFLLCGAIPILASILLACRYLFRSFYPLALLITLFLLVGVLRYPAAFSTPPEGHSYYLFNTPRIVTLVAELDRAPTKTETGITLIARLSEFITEQNERLAASGLVRLSMAAEDIPQLSPGDYFIAKTRISRISSLKNPGMFDYRQYLAQKNIWLKGWINSPLLIHKIARYSHTDYSFRLTRTAEKIRTGISRFIDHTLPSPEAALYKAVLIGDRSAVPGPVSEQFKKSGTMHLLAISGLHIGILALFSLFICRLAVNRFPRLLLLFPSWKSAALLTVFPLLLYALIAGFQPPVVRAVIMYVVVAAALLSNRQVHLFNAILLAAFLILAVSPDSLFSVSFQLSFAAVLAIVLCMRERSIRRNKALLPGSDSSSLVTGIKKLLTSSLYISIAACLGTFPLLLYFFNRVSLLSPLSTLIIGPLICFFALPLGLVGCLLILPFPATAAWLFQTGGAVLHLVVYLNSFFASLPFAEIRFLSPSWIEIFLYYLTLVNFLLIRSFSWSRKAAFFSFSFLLLFFMLYQSKTFSNNAAQITFLDVGQGSATIARLPGGRVLLVDGGRRSLAHFDAGREIIAPFLWKNRILKVHDIIVTHPHADHFNGLYFILEHFKPERLWISRTDESNPDYTRLLQRALAGGAEVKIPSGGMLLSENDSSQALVFNCRTLLFPQDRENKLPPEHVNTGLMVKITAFGHSLLLPGDLGGRDEMRIAAVLGSLLQADILKAAHHGSPGSNSRSFLRQVSPHWVILSTSWNANQLVNTLSERFAPANLPVFRATSLDGAVTVQISREKMEVITAEKGEEKTALRF
jgi:competence protein ComEC